MYLKDMRGEMITRFNTENHIFPLLEVEDVVFANAGTWLEGSTNAQVTVRIKPTCPYYSGSFNLKYNRISITDRLRDVTLPRGSGPYVDTDDVCKALRNYYGISAYAEDFFPETYPSTATEIKLVPVINSLVWLPTYTVTLPIVD
jgi:hypothetical protein